MHFRHYPQSFYLTRSKERLGENYIVEIKIQVPNNIPPSVLKKRIEEIIKEEVRDAYEIMKRIDEKEALSWLLH